MNWVNLGQPNGSLNCGRRRRHITEQVRHPTRYFSWGAVDLLTTLFHHRAGGQEIARRPHLTECGGFFREIRDLEPLFIGNHWSLDIGKCAVECGVKSHSSG